ncbi:MAG: hypothetical protein WC295_01560 [Methanoregula sp.]|jgi:hypothetical protein
MSETITHRTERPDSISLGKEAHGGILKVYLDSGDLQDAQRRIDNMVRARQYLLERLSGTGIT